MVKTRSGKGDKERSSKSKDAKQHKTKRKDKRKRRKEKNTGVRSAPRATGNREPSFLQHLQGFTEGLLKELARPRVRVHRQVVRARMSSIKAVHEVEVRTTMNVDLAEIFPNQRVVYKNAGGKLHIKKAIVHKGSELVTPSPMPAGWKVDKIVDLNV